MAPGTEVKPPRMRTGSALSAISERLNCTPLLAPHMTPATMATRPATDHTTTQIVLSGMPMRERGLVVVGHRPQRPPDARPLEEHGQHRDQDGGGDGRGQLQLVDLHALDA